MAQKDYVADPGSGQIMFKGAPVATYDIEKKEVKEYVNDGANRKRWIAAAVKNAPDADPKANFDEDSEDALETAIAIAEGEEDFYIHFPAAPRPANNFVGYKHIEVFEWVQKTFPKAVGYLYPNGPWNPKVAGMEGNKTIRPLESIEIEYLN